MKHTNAYIQLLRSPLFWLYITCMTLAFIAIWRLYPGKEIYLLPFGGIIGNALFGGHFNNRQTPAEEDDNSSDFNDLLVIEYAIDGFGSRQDLDKRHRLEDLLQAILDQEDLGYCDGGSTGSDSMEVFCYVSNFEQAKKIIQDKLKNTEFSNYTKFTNSETNEE